MAVPTRDVPLRDARTGIEARLRNTLAQWGDSELSPAPKPDDEAALQSFLRTFEGAPGTVLCCGNACLCLAKPIPQLHRLPCSVLCTCSLDSRCKLRHTDGAACRGEVEGQRVGCQG